MKICLGRLSLAEPVCGIIPFDLGCLSIGVLNAFGLDSLCGLSVGRFSTLVNRWVSPVLVA